MPVISSFSLSLSVRGVRLGDLGVDRSAANIDVTDCAETPSCFPPANGLGGPFGAEGLDTGIAGGGGKSTISSGGESG